MIKTYFPFLLLICPLWLYAQKSTLPPVPEDDYNLVLQAPINTWDEAVPLGNGLLGGLLWGDHNTIRLSLDRGDLWDERSAVGPEWWKKYTYPKAVQQIAKKHYKTVGNWWNPPYDGITPTKIPAGRLEIKLPVSEMVKRFELDLSSAEATATFNTKANIRVIYSATKPVVLISIKGTATESIHLLSPMDVFNRKHAKASGLSSGGTVKDLGYPPAQPGHSDKAKWYIQQASDGLSYCVYVQSKRVADETLLALTITSTKDRKDFFNLAAKQCTAALEKGYATTRLTHQRWWKKFWQQSSVSIPDTAIQEQYDLVQYFYGAASHQDAPPMPLQGVWTADNGTLPPWKGDYHNDLNTQMTYMAYQEAGRFDQGASYLDFLWDRRQVFRRFAKDFYGTNGLACPGVMSLSGQPLGGWEQYSLSPTMSAWSAHLFYLHWRYTMDDDFLKEKAYPWCSEVGECMLELLKPDEHGILKLPLSSSPEIFDNSPRAWLKPNSNYDLMCLKMLFLSLQEMATASHKKDAAQKWAKAAAGLGDFHTKENGTLLLDADTELASSHRHLSNIIGLYPFNLITSEGGAKDRKIIQSSLDQWQQLGTSQWCGYTYSWMSCLDARVGNAKAAIKNLEIFVKAFILRNGFHVNGDQTRSGYSDFTYRPFTLEGNFLAAQAVQEMLLQSWSPTPGIVNSGIIRFFPATPDKWENASFSHLRAEGGYIVSAVRQNSQIKSFRIQATKSGRLRIKDNFNGQQPEWNIAHVQKIEDYYELNLNKGQILEATF